MSREAFPSSGKQEQDLLDQLKSYKKNDLDWENGRSFSYIYKTDVELMESLKKAQALFFAENALNPSAFPSIRRMEGEIIDRCLDLFGAADTGVGSLTSGGTESILMAVKAAW